MLEVFALTYLFYFVTVTEIYARIRNDRIVRDAFAKAKESGDGLTIVCTEGGEFYDAEMAELSRVTFISPGIVPEQDFVVLDMHTAATDDNVFAFENVQPEKLFCVAFPFWCISAYVKSRRIILASPPSSSFFWSISNPFDIWFM